MSVEDVRRDEIIKGFKLYPFLEYVTFAEYFNLSSLLVSVLDESRI